MSSLSEAPYARYRLKVASSLQAERYIVTGQQGGGLEIRRELRRNAALRVRDASGTELAELRLLEAFYIPSMERFELFRGDSGLATIERRRRRFKVVTENVGTVLIIRDRLAREHTLTRAGSRVGSIKRRRLHGRRIYDLELLRDVDPIPFMVTAVLIDRSRRLKWHAIFTSPGA